jgi:hypothetical protein
VVVAAGREPVGVGRCECGLHVAEELHDGWHKLWWWNRSVFAAAAAKREAEFEQRLDDRGQRERPPVSEQGAMEVGTGASTAHRANPKRERRR